MNNKLFLFLIIPVCSLIILSCSDENIIGNWVSDGNELEEGSKVYFNMEQNYPNPFNPSTVINFRVFERIKVELIIWSDDWVKKATLLDKFCDYGNYQVIFNAEGFPSGEYFYTMTGESVTQIRKMKIVK